jgi:hypothetical protein
MTDLVDRHLWTIGWILWVVYFAAVLQAFLWAR